MCEASLIRDSDAQPERQMDLELMQLSLLLAHSVSRRIIDFWTSTSIYLCSSSWRKPRERENITCKLIVIWPVYGNCIFPSAPSGAFCCGGHVVQEQQLCNLALGGSIGANSCTRTQTTARRRFQRKWRIPIDLGRFEVRCCGSISGIVSMTLFVLICTVKWLIFCWCDSCQKYTSNFKLYFFNILHRKKNVNFERECINRNVSVLSKPSGKPI